MAVGVHLAAEAVGADLAAAGAVGVDPAAGVRRAAVAGSVCAWGW